MPDDTLCRVHISRFEDDIIGSVDKTTWTCSIHGRSDHKEFSSCKELDELYVADLRRTFKIPKTHGSLKLRLKFSIPLFVLAIGILANLLYEHFTNGSSSIMNVSHVMAYTILSTLGFYILFPKSWKTDRINFVIMFLTCIITMAMIIGVSTQFSTTIIAGSAFSVAFYSLLGQIDHKFPL